MEQCANCGGVIGQLEQPYLWGEHVVCGACYQRLGTTVPTTVPVNTTTDDLVGIAAEVGATSANAAPRRRVLLPGEIICPNPNCGYVGRPERKPTGNVAVLVVLLLFWIIPGVLYWILMSGYTNYCPRCQAKIGKAE